jgi:hypothetical protein
MYCHEETKTLDSRYIIYFVVLTFRDTNVTHANLAIVDTLSKTIEIYEPHGGYRVHQSLKRGIMGELWPSFTLIEPDISVGAQIGDRVGYCMVFCFKYVKERFYNIEIKPNKFKVIKEQICATK